MIQPLKSAQSAWSVTWVDLEEPIPMGGDFILPTLLIVTDSAGVPIGTPEILEELDQPKIENHLARLFEQRGAPDRVTISASDEWDTEGWKAFSEDYRIEIRFHKFAGRDPLELRELASALSAQFHASAPPAAAPEAIARGLLKTALRVRSERKKIALLQKAVDRDANCTGARIELADAEFQKGNWKSSLHSYDLVIERESPNWVGAVGVRWWEDPSTRPFLRGLFGRSMTLWHQGKHQAAARAFLRLLDINRADNQGARFFVPLLYLLSGDPEAANDYFEGYETRYPNDYAEPSFLFGWALAAHLSGDESTARARYRAGMIKNIYIAPMLLELPEPPGGLWLPNDRAEPQYASEFVDSYAVLWDRDPAALRLLREVHHELVPRIERLVEHRRRMADFQDQRYDPDYRARWIELTKIEEGLTSPDPA